MTGVCRMMFLLVALLGYGTNGWADLPDMVERIKPSIVAVGTYRSTDSPPFALRGTGFAIGDGRLVATNAHVIANDPLAAKGSPEMMVMTQTNGQVRLWRARTVAADPDHDIAILRMEDGALPPLDFAGMERVREGQSIGFIGFPIGNALGFSPVTHRGIVSAITPVALPSPTAHQLNEKLIRRLKAGAFNVLQLDATAYPGNSGSPVFEVESGKVIGIINMVYVKGTRESAISQPTGITYAIPITFLQELLQTVR